MAASGTAGRMVTWALACYPKSERLNGAKQRVFLQLIQKHQLLNVFKFVMYSEHIKLATPQMQ